jgi:hypothetical protein
MGLSYAKSTIPDALRHGEFAVVGTELYIGTPDNTPSKVGVNLNDITPADLLAKLAENENFAMGGIDTAELYELLKQVDGSILGDINTTGGADGRALMFDSESTQFTPQNIDPFMQLVFHEMWGIYSSINDPFIMTIDTRIEGGSYNGGTGVGSFRFRSKQGGGHSHLILWGDGSYTVQTDTDVIKNYATPGVYTVQVVPTNGTVFNATNWGNQGDATKIISIDDWGGHEIRYPERFVNNFPNLTAVPLTGLNIDNAYESTNYFLNETGITGGLENFDLQMLDSIIGLLMRTGYTGGVDLWNLTGFTSLAYTLGGVGGDSSIGADPNPTGLASWDISAVTDLRGFIQGNNAVNIADISGWVFTAVTNISSLFIRIDNTSPNPANTDFSFLSTAPLENISYVFNESHFEGVGVDTWDVSAVTSATGLFTDSGLTTANYDAILIAWAAQSVQTGVILDAGTVQYTSAAAAARATLVAAGWTINDGGQTS